MKIKKEHHDSWQCQGQYCKSPSIDYLIIINNRGEEIALCNDCFKKLKNKMGEN